jgi:DNA (cytosine-5)-methyltransferase 1
MISSFKTVDIFAGPGGLAEGFSSLRDASGQRVFDISLSVEKEKSAFATLRLRAFTRQFSELPDSYFDYIAKRISREQLIEKHSDEWEAAVRETALLELGSENAREWLPPVLENIRETAKDRTILIGGPLAKRIHWSGGQGTRESLITTPLRITGISCIANTSISLSSFNPWRSSWKT